MNGLHGIKLVALVVVVIVNFLGLGLGLGLLYVKNQSVRQGQTPRLGTLCPTLCDHGGVGSLTFTTIHATLKMQQTEPTVYSPLPRRREDGVNPDLLPKTKNSFSRGILLLNRCNFYVLFRTFLVLSID